MFKNMGSKIKTLAKVLCWINISIGILVAIAGIVVTVGGFSIYDRADTGASIVIIFGSILGGALWALFAWIGSFLLCGYGELIENTAITAKNTQTLVEMKNFELSQNAQKASAASTPDSETQS